MGVSYYRSHASRSGKDKAPVLVINRISSDYLRSRGADVSGDIFGLAFYFPSLAKGGVGSYTKLRVKNLVPVEEAESEV